MTLHRRLAVLQFLYRSDKRWPIETNGLAKKSCGAMARAGWPLDFNRHTLTSGRNAIEKRFTHIARQAAAAAALLLATLLHKINVCYREVNYKKKAEKKELS
jgi:ADP-ribosylglycohydrolase